MARRRRFRRRRRTYHSYKDQRDQQNNEAPIINNSITTTPVTRNVRGVLTPIQNLDTPRVLRSNSLVLRKNMNSEVAARSRSNSFVTPKNQNVYNNVNCTNLNLLFEDKSKVKAKATSNLLLEEQRCANKGQYAASAPKARELSPVMVDVGTQTVYFSNSADKNCLVENKYCKVMNETKYNIHTFAQIFETPKIPHNFSPAEYTVFAPQYQASSTPVCGTDNNNLLADIAKNLIHNKKLAMKNSFYFDCTPNPKPTSTVLDKSKLYSVNKHRFYKSMSPKIYRNTYIKLCNKQRNNNYDKTAQNNMNNNCPVPKSFSPMKRSALQKSDNFLNVGCASTYTKVMARVRSFHQRNTSKWVGKFLEVCAWFGLTIKTGLLAIYKPKINATIVADDNPQEAICACKNVYKAKIGELEEQMKELRTNCDKEVESVKTEMAKLRSELVELMDAKLEEIKNKIKNVPSTPTCGDFNIPRPPPPPPMLPPPPPLPPPLPLSMSSTPVTRRPPKLNRESKKENDDTRPVISLDDILKVKLRKTGERQQTPKLTRRNTQPVVSMDMLKQVKLRPATRTQAASFTDISNNSTLSTSPASSLTRILSKVDTNLHRVKRLKRIGGHNSDDICRKMHGFKREFSGV